MVTILRNLGLKLNICRYTDDELKNLEAIVASQIEEAQLFLEEVKAEMAGREQLVLDYGM
jgi:hypothetical protein